MLIGLERCGGPHLSLRSSAQCLLFGALCMLDLTYSHAANERSDLAGWNDVCVALKARNRYGDSESPGSFRAIAPTGSSPSERSFELLGIEFPLPQELSTFSVGTVTADSITVIATAPSGVAVALHRTLAGPVEGLREFIDHLGGGLAAESSEPLEKYVDRTFGQITLTDYDILRLSFSPPDLVCSAETVKRDLIAAKAASVRPYEKRRGVYARDQIEVEGYRGYAVASRLKVTENKKASDRVEILLHDDSIAYMLSYTLPASAKQLRDSVYRALAASSLR